MILTRKVPRQEDLKHLDSFDLAFLSLTGHVEWMDPFDALFFAQKAVQGHGSKEYLWGPEADLLSKTLAAAWKKVGAEHVKRIQAAFDLSGDVSVSDAKLKKALAGSKKLGKQMWLACGKKVRAVMETTVERAQVHFDRQRAEAIKAVTGVGWEGALAAANTDHVQAYMTKYPDRILHPEIQRLAELTRVKPAARTIDRIQLRDRIGSIHGRGEQYFANMSDVQVGRTWTNTGIQMAHEQKVTEYMVVSEGDAQVCPACKRLHGKHFPVGPAYDKMQQGMQTTNPDKLNKLFPFPRVKQLDNKSPKQIRAMNLQPPFHGKCRCDVVFLWRQVAVERIGPIGSDLGRVNAVPAPAEIAAGKSGVMVFEYDGRKFFAKELRFGDIKSFQREAAASKAMHKAGLGKYTPRLYTADAVFEGKATRMIASELLEDCPSIAKLEMYERYRLLAKTGDLAKERLVLQDYLMSAWDRSASNILVHRKTGAIKMIDYEMAFSHKAPAWERHELMQFLGKKRIELEGPDGIKFIARSHGTGGPAGYKFNSKVLQETIDSADDVIAAIKGMDIPAGLKKEWTEIVLKRKEELIKWSKPAELVDSPEERRRICESMMQRSMNFERSRMTERGAKALEEQIKKTELGTRHIPIRLLEDLDDKGLRIKWHLGEYNEFEVYTVKGKLTGTVSLLDDASFSDAAHEVGHALDSFFAGGAKGFGESYGYWKGSRYVTAKDGVEYRKWFRANIKKGQIGKNGNGKYWKDNWIDNYDGLIYETADKTIAEEFFAMNSERYSLYRNALEDFDTKVVAYAKRFKDGVPEKLIGAQLYSRQEALAWARGEMALEEAREAYALRLSQWGKVRERYGGLASFMEEKLYLKKPLSPVLKLPKVIE